MAEVRRQASQTESRELPADLQSYIPAVTPDFAAPYYLKPLTDLFERARRGEEVRAIVSTPPQHGKSQTCLHALNWLIQDNPKKRHGFATYAQRFAQDQSKIARRVAHRAGVQLDSESADRWGTHEGGGVIFTGVGGPLTGHAIDGVLVLDDLIKNRVEAESKLIRDRAMEWLSSVALTRVHPGASVIFIATRWHPDDPHGRLLKQGWEYVKLPAISDDGEALWPEGRPLDWLERQRDVSGMSEYDWWALYMCEPRPRGGALFRDVHYYDELPQDGSYRTGCGADWAYTAKTHADYSVAVEGRMYGQDLYLTNMIRAQVEAPEFAARLQGIEAREVHSFMSGTEKALEQFIRKTLGIKIRMLPTTGDKFVRAQDVATAWNHGGVLVPRNAPWAKDLLEEVLAFTGVSDTHDDIVDALAGLHRAFRRGAVTAVQKPDWL